MAVPSDYAYSGSTVSSVPHGRPRRTRRQQRKRSESRILSSLQEKLVLCYRKYFLELVLRRIPLPPSTDGRRIPLRCSASAPALVDERRGSEYISNTIRSSRYTLYDFFPKQLLFQATRLSNFYFIVIGIPQAIPGFSTTGSFTNIIPLLFFILLTIVKEGYDDYRRHRLDKVENNKVARVLREVKTDTAGVSAGAWMTGLVSSLNLKGKSVTVEEFELTTESADLKWKTLKWRDIRVGDVITLSRDEPVPADLVLLSTTGEHGIAYAETMALDGETNLKSKYALPALQHCSSAESIQSCNALFVVEDPNPLLYSFEGHVTMDEKTFPLTLNEVILRGSVLKNTASITGLVVNTGEECKIRMNANHHPKAKKPRMEKYANQIVLTLVLYVIVLSVGCSMGYLMWQRSTERSSFYLAGAAVDFKEIIIGFAIMFNNVIPLALYVSMEIMRLGQMWLLNNDIELYDERTDTPMRCNTNTILENLGQVTHLLTDKTGTLTENVMKFRKMSVAGVAWVDAFDQEQNRQRHLEPTSGQGDTRANLSCRIPEPSSPVTTGVGIMSPRASRREFSTAELLQELRSDPSSVLSQSGRDFILGMALCNTCIPEMRDDGLIFQASSPDEVALVSAARDLGYEIVRRTSHAITLSIALAGNGHDVVNYEILDVIEFSSSRKRMSVVLRCPDGSVWLLCKGADTVLFPRLRESKPTAPSPISPRSSRAPDPGESCRRHIDGFAAEGLRTLVFAQRKLSQEEYAGWKYLYIKATTSLHRRQEAIEAAAEKIEHSLELLGASAIEDKLQQGVPETIRKLRRANISVWMLTGDKRETAINIAHSAGICHPGSEVHIIDFRQGDLKEQIRTARRANTADSLPGVLVIDGETLGRVLADADLEEAFYELTDTVESVVCCRASPSQKASLVKGISYHLPDSLTMAIGDGSNDIAMIQASHVGVGISGQEGLQAARVADYSIAQFRFLQRLLLVHGHWNYVRTAKFILMTFWKEMFFYMMQALYQGYNGYSGTSLYEAWSLTVLNTLFTSLCVLVMGVFEQDLCADTLLALPELYRYGQRNMGLNLYKYLAWVIGATIDGLLVWFICWAAYGRIRTVNDQGLFALGDLAFSLGIAWTNIKLLILETHCKTIVAISSFSITFGGWWIWNAFLSKIYEQRATPYAVRHGFTETFGTDPLWWLTFVFVLLLLFALDLLYRACKRTMKVMGLMPLTRLWKRVPHTHDDDVETWQELEQDSDVREKLKSL